jgi:hypothetical protein
MHGSSGKLNCRVKEWKAKKGVCAYDKNIYSIARRKETIPNFEKTQKRMTDFDGS